MLIIEKRYQLKISAFSRNDKLNGNVIDLSIKMAGHMVKRQIN